MGWQTKRNKRTEYVQINQQQFTSGKNSSVNNFSSWRSIDDLIDINNEQFIVIALPSHVHKIYPTPLAEFTVVSLD